MKCLPMNCYNNEKKEEEELEENLKHRIVIIRFVVIFLFDTSMNHELYS
jgi:hypothetical protein